MIIRLLHLLISGSFVITGRHWIRSPQTDQSKQRPGGQTPVSSLKLGLTTSGESVEEPGFPTLLVTLSYVQALARKSVVSSLCSLPVIGRLWFWSWFVSDFVDEISGFVLLFFLREEQVYCVGVVSCAPGGRWRRSGQLCRRYQQLLIRKRMWIRKMMARSARLGSWRCGASAPINLVMASKCCATTTSAPTGSKNTSFPAPFPRRFLPSFCCSIILERFFYSSVFSLHGCNLIDMPFRGCNCSDIGADRMAHNRIW